MKFGDGIVILEWPIRGCTSCTIQNNTNNDNNNNNNTNIYTG